MGGLRRERGWARQGDGRRQGQGQPQILQTHRSGTNRNLAVLLFNVGLVSAISVNRLL